MHQQVMMLPMMLALFAALGVITAAADASARPKHLVMIVIDDLGFGACHESALAGRRAHSERPVAHTAHTRGAIFPHEAAAACAHHTPAAFPAGFRAHSTRAARALSATCATGGHCT